MDPLTRQLTDYASNLTYADLSPDAIDKTKRIILDSIGWARREPSQHRLPVRWPARSAHGIRPPSW
jgi:2-methylcitrate dehydratase PrpD